MQRFASSYDVARARFRDACAASGAQLQALRHPSATGPAGEALYADIAWLGPRDARTLLIVSSGTHGVEGLCGSGIQTALLVGKTLSTLPRSCAVILVHASNPYGFAHLRRVTEGNVDLNRNFIDHAAPPASDAYEEVHPWLVPSDWNGPARLAAELAIAAFRAERGDSAFQAAVTGGQYRHADGLFYGGREPVWSNAVWRGLVREYCQQRAHVIHIDLHTGLGPYAYGEKIVAIPLGARELVRMKSLFGDDLRSPWSGDSASAPVAGALASVFGDLPADTRVSPIALEFGTVPLEHMLAALRTDNWVRARLQPAADAIRSVRHLMKTTFFVDEDDWQTAVVARTDDTIRRVLQALDDHPGGLS